MSKPIFISLFSLALLPLSPAAAEQVLIDDFVVSANRTPLQDAKIGSAVVAVEREEIEEAGAISLADFLTRLPGLSMSRDGGQGQPNNVRIRGLHKKYTKVLIDGIDVSDVSQPETAVDFSTIPLGDIERIEVLKGSQGSLYGGDAVAGVISITTRRPIKEGVGHSYQLEAGSYGTKRGRYGLTAANERGFISLNASGFHSNGISAAEEKNGNTENDASSLYALSGTGEVAITENVTAFAVFRFSKAEAEYDDSFPVVADANNVADATTFGGRIGARWGAFDNRLENTFSVQTYTHERNITNAFGSLAFKGERRKVDYLGQYTVSNQLKLMFGADGEYTTALNNRSAGNLGSFAQAIVQPVESLTLSLSGRYDNHSSFGGFTTYRATGAYSHQPTGTTLRASVGTGFRVPALDELFASYGNPNLKPEESFGFDLGITQSLFGGRLVASATYFSTEIENLVEYDVSIPPFGGYNQLGGKSSTKGVELTAALQATDVLAFTASYTYTDTKSPTGGKLARVPEHVASFGVSYAPNDKWELGLTAIYNDGAVDTRGLEFGNYTLIDARALYNINDHVSLYGRGENLLNENYQTSRGYSTPDRSFYLGVKGQF